MHDGVAVAATVGDSQTLQSLRLEHLIRVRSSRRVATLQYEIKEAIVVDRITQGSDSDVDAAR